MQWLQAHGADVLFWITVAGVVADTVSQLLPNGKAKKLLATLAHVLPGAIFSAIKTASAPYLPPVQK